MDLNNFKELVEIFKKYKKSFINQELPIQLDDSHSAFNRIENEKIELIEARWYDNTKNRDKNFLTYLKINKDELLEIN